MARRSRSDELRMYEGIIDLLLTCSPARLSHNRNMRVVVGLMIEGLDVGLHVPWEAPTIEEREDAARLLKRLTGLEAYHLGRSGQRAKSRGRSGRPAKSRASGGRGSSSR
jgi:hypothetical protein